jgi:hypothetical protein
MQYKLARWAGCVPLSQLFGHAKRRLAHRNETVVQQPSKLEVEDHGLGIYLPAPRPVIATERAGVVRLLTHQRLQPLPKFFDAP